MWSRLAQHRPDALDALRARGIAFTINPIGRRLKEIELAELIRDFDILIAGTEPITARVMDNAPRLRLISRVGIGLDSVDLLAARQRGIPVSYTPDSRLRWTCSQIRRSSSTTSPLIRTLFAFALAACGDTSAKK